ncbi:unannotated protein [freshwater metagenome]|uniref:Unannotated protein n=1 Tax=freshwater metagenome TaxID=449393 RepID=A0A6J6JUW8_9ZZZZ
MIRIAKITEFGSRLVAGSVFLVDLVFLEAVFQWRVSTHHHWRHELGDFVA